MGNIGIMKLLRQNAALGRATGETGNRLFCFVRKALGSEASGIEYTIPI
jgi:hypothetical protein